MGNTDLFLTLGSILERDTGIFVIKLIINYRIQASGPVELLIFGVYELWRAGSHRLQKRPVANDTD